MLKRQSRPYKIAQNIRDDIAMADKEKPMILSFNTVWVAVVFVFSLGVLHSSVKDDISGNTKSISDLKKRVESDSGTIYLEIKSLTKGLEKSNRQDESLKKDIEWIKKGQTEIKDLILKNK